MLRITLPNPNGHGVYILEGRLAGLWTQELLRVVQETNQDCGNTFDLQDVTCVDSAGEEALRVLNRGGGRFITESAYGKDLCKRLKLRRVPASDAFRQRRDNSFGRGHGRPANAKDTEPFSSADERRPQECEE